MFVLSRRTSYGMVLSKQINLSAVDSKYSSVVKPSCTTQEVTKSALGTRLPAINLTNILNHFICLYFPS